MNHTPTHPDSAFPTPQSALPYRLVSTTTETFRDHRLINWIPGLNKQGPQFLALVDSFTRDGLHEPVKITARHEFADPDSRDRLCAALAAGLPNVPCQIIPDDQVATTFLSTLLLRRHFTKSALAYLAYPALKPAFDEARVRRLEIIQKPNDLRSALPALDTTVEAYAEKLGISRRLLFEAKSVHEIFARDPEYCALMEPRILGEPIGGEHEEKRPVGLGAVIAGHAGRKNKNEPRVDSHQLDLFRDGWKSLRNRLVYWDNFTDEQKTQAIESAREAFSVMPGELREALLKEARRLAKQDQAV